MSQLESVSALSITSEQKQKMTSIVKKLARVGIDEEDEYYCPDVNPHSAISKLNKELRKAEELGPDAVADCEEMREKHLEELYRDYKFKNYFEDDAHKLPVWSKREKILEIIDAHSFVIVVGGTGCGN
jgi:HrpA-like RNA helicase